MSKETIFRRAAELVLCLAIASAFMALAAWLLVAWMMRWHLANCFQPEAGLACALSAIFLQYWWLAALMAIPASALILFAFLGRRSAG